MLFKLFKSIRTFFLIPVADEYKAELTLDLNRTNMAKVKTIAITFLVLEVLMVAASLIIKKEALFSKPDLYYFAMYLFLIAAMSIFLGIFHKLGKNIPAHGMGIRIAGISFTCLLLFWCAGISLLDQMSYGQIIIYLTAIISIAVVPLFQPLTFFLLYVAAQTFFVALMPYFQESGDIIFGNYANSTLFIIISFVISRIRYKTWIGDFKNRIIIQEKSIEINQINKELEEANEKLRYLSQTDSLTGVFNRSMFDKTIKIEWNRCKRNSIPLSLFMIDIDFFKAFNDNYGHQAGDVCIKQVAGVLLSFAKRSSDSVSRYGGDEFSVILPHLGKEDASKLAEQIRAKIAASYIPNTYASIAEHATISMGVHTIIPSDDSSIDAFIEAADRALYEAKKDRNKIVSA